MHAGQLGTVSTLGVPVVISVGASPFTYTAPKAGAVLVNGGTPSLVEYARGGTFNTIGALGGTFPVWPGDQIRITYVLAPTMTLVPS